MLEGNDAAALALITILVVAIASLTRPATPAARATVCCLAGIAALVYINWRVGHLQGLLREPVLQNLWLWIFALAEFLGLSDFLLFMLLMSRTRDNKRLADAHEQKLRHCAREKLPRVDVWIATCDEEWSILEKTIVGALHIDYPREKIRICVLDDGRRGWLRDRCHEMGVEHITRPDNKGKKAGNHNHALLVTHAPFILSLDADFVPFPNILFRLLGFFEDPSVAIVQTPQTYYNIDVIRKSLGLRLAPDELAIFHREIQPARDAWNAVIYCGSCAVLRRSALEAVGGFVTGTEVEDLPTAVKLLSQGFKIRYLNETLSVGLSAESHVAFHDQRNRWCRGCLQLVFKPFGPLGRGLGLIQRLFFIQSQWIVLSVLPIIFYLTPSLFWLFGWRVYPQAPPDDLLLMPILLFTTIYVAISWVSRLHWVPILFDATQLFTAVELAPTAVASLLKPFGKPLIRIMPVTPKGAAAIPKPPQRIDLRTFGVLLSLALGTLGTFLYGAMTDHGPVHHAVEMFAMTFWTTYILLVTAIATLICFESPNRPGEESFRVSQPITLMLTDGRSVSGVALRVSLAGAQVRLDQEAGPGVGERISLELPTIGRIPGSIVRQAARGECSVQFDTLEGATRHALIRALFTDAQVQSVALKFRATPIFIDLARRYFGVTW